MNASRILVIGGGFAGMAAALELDKFGAQVELLEQDPDWRTDGAGISLHGATLRVFQRLGIYEAFAREGSLSNGFDILEPTSDRVLVTLPTPVVGDTGYGSAGIMRPRLAELLREQVRRAGIPVRLGYGFSGLEQQPAGVRVRFGDGSSAEYDLVVGADGIHSSVRAQAFADAPAPAYVGQGVWRALVDWPQALERPGMWSDGELKVGINRVSATQGYVFLTEARGTTEHLDPQTFIEYFRALLRRFPSPTLQLIAAGLGAHSQILYRPLYQLLLPRPWHRGRVVLIGDAVHSTTPHLAAGACAALEDAVVLADELARTPDITAALAAFEARRWERCRMIVTHSARLCEIERTRGDRQEHAELMRHSMLALAEPV
ncbi:hypothetical protein SB11R_15140 [Pseudomonas oryzihabitans]|nr:hypothetical protein SB11R_15140 [Pseudomonas psychrotolerans]